MIRSLLGVGLVLALSAPAGAGVGDPQLGTDHPWYPGELACSTWDRLFAHQEAVYKRVTGRDCATDEDKVLAAWLWRNTHYWHGEEGAEDWWGKGFGKGGDARAREYWTGLFAHGFGLCGTTHSQWVAEMEARLGHGRGDQSARPGIRRSRCSSPAVPTGRGSGFCSTTTSRPWCSTRPGNTSSGCGRSRPTGSG
jgi:hypothetical protein